MLLATRQRISNTLNYVHSLSTLKPPIPQLTDVFLLVHPLAAEEVNVFASHVPVYLVVDRIHDNRNLAFVIADVDVAIDPEALVGGGGAQGQGHSEAEYREGVHPVVIAVLAGGIAK